MNSAYIFDGLFPTFYRGPLHLWNTITGKSKETSTNVSNDATSTSNSMGSAYSQANMNITASMNQMNTNVSTLSTMSSNNAINAAANAKTKLLRSIKGCKAMSLLAQAI